MDSLGKRSPLVNDSPHAFSELLQRDKPVIVLVHFIHDIIPDYRASLCNVTASKGLLQLILANEPIAIVIQHLEGPL